MVLKLTAHETCWVQLTTASTGSQIFMGVVEAGRSMTWTENEAVRISLGNPAGVVLTANGEPVRTNSTQPETLSFAPES